MKHSEMLLDWFAKRRTITPMEAWRDLGIYRLGARIYDLRADGYNIHTERMDVGKGSGKPARYHFLGKAA